MGPYDVVRVLGEGGFGRTLEARHRVLGLRACLKVGHRREDDWMLLEEARLLWDLHHPCLPTLRDLFETERGLVLAMRFVEGTPLGRLDPDSATRVLGRLVRALKVLHHRGIVHNDIKPANIILEPDRTGVVLVDFGAASRRPRSASVAPAYTPVFTAPEVVGGRPPTPESDFYSLGMTILAALGADLERRIQPPGVPERLLELLADMTRREAGRRERDPLERVKSLL